MINYICELTLEKLCSSNIIEEDQIEVYHYGLELLIATILKTLGFLIIAIVLNLVKEALIFTIFFSSLRIQAGGYHANTPFKCFVGTLILMFPGIILVGMIPMEKQLYYILINILISILLVYLYAPVESENKPLTKEEVKIYRHRSLLTVVGGSVIVLLLIYAYQSFIYLGSIALTAFSMESLTLIDFTKKQK